MEDFILDIFDDQVQKTNNEPEALTETSETASYDVARFGIDYFDYGTDFRMGQWTLEETPQEQFHVFPVLPVYIKAEEEDDL